MVDITRRDLLKSSALVPIMPILIKPSVEKENTVVYKVTRNNLTSFCSPKNITIQYELNKWIKPKVGKIFAFANLNNGLTFQNSYRNLYGPNDFRLFKCMARNVKSIKYMDRLYINDDVLFKDIISWWKTRIFRINELKDKFSWAPPGSVGVSEIKLIEELYG